MKHEQIKTLVITALFIALTCVATIVIQIPSPMSGYVNLGDCLVLLSAWLLGPWYGAAAAGLGSALADILTSYAHYAPGTLVIKAAMALAAALIFQAAKKKGANSLVPQVIGGIAAEIIMIIGYFGYAALLLGKGLAAAASIPGNIVQGIFGILAAVLLAQLLEKSHALSRLNV